ncbi:ATP-grasp domain-containing protein [Archangium sp.]|uniref:ATP-grasp domain-containing protein n=1 Tax=Archangium sp. TaxID=1872627 RepID=UPI002D4072D7|nr:ATP-grasp domain-containing protein [Archangium sp.]HYO56458.1 ATP-grasp domain-containing protein [Archangium sp.]
MRVVPQPQLSPERPRVLVVCPGPWDQVALGERFHARFTLNFHGQKLVEQPSLWEGIRFDVFRWVEHAVETWRGQELAGILGTGDYPGCMFAALIGEQLGLPVPSPESVVRLSHKYYSRRIQQRHVPEATPDFEPFDPFAGPPRLKTLDYPLFIKPVKGTMSIRAQLVRDPGELRRAVHFSWRERVEKHLLLRPFQHLLHRYTEGQVPAHWFIAERPLEGVQVTVDGFVERGTPVIMGIVDSVMYPGTISFQRFDYPSRLPEPVQARMRDVAVRLMRGSGFNHACFNIEMFYDPQRDTVQVIEVNPRMSYQFADLYERVDGMNTYEAQLALAVGRPVPWRAKAGRDGAASSFVLRRFSDARVLRVPSAEEIAELQAHFPGTIVQVLCAPGERLSSHDQDVGSFRYGIINMGAPTYAELLERYREVERRLNFEFASPDLGAARATASTQRSA